MSYLSLEITLRNRILDQKSILFIGQSIWNKLSNYLKILDTTTYVIIIFITIIITP